MTCKLSIMMFLLCLSSVCIAQERLNESSDSSYSHNPKFSCVQIDAITLIAVTQLGGLVDFDFWQKRKSLTKNNKIGIRIGIEYYAYLDPGGSSQSGPYTDYSIYLRHSMNSKKFTINILGGFAYHTLERNYYDTDKFLFRIGMEFKYQLINKFLGIIAKGSTSFLDNTTFAGVGFSFGFYD